MIDSPLFFHPDQEAGRLIPAGQRQVRVMPQSLTLWLIGRLPRTHTVCRHIAVAHISHITYLLLGTQVPAGACPWLFMRMPPMLPIFCWFIWLGSMLP